MLYLRDQIKRNIVNGAPIPGWMIKEVCFDFFGTNYETQMGEYNLAEEWEQGIFIVTINNTLYGTDYTFSPDKGFDFEDIAEVKFLPLVPIATEVLYGRGIFKNFFFNERSCSIFNR